MLFLPNVCLNLLRPYVIPWTSNLKSEGKKKSKQLSLYLKHHDMKTYGGVEGRAIAQAVSRWLHTVAARVRAWVWASRICGGQSGSGAGFLRVLRLPLPIFIPPNSPSSRSPWAGKIGHSVADMPSGPSMDSTPTMRIKKIMGVEIYIQPFLISVLNRAE
jgi:hypothetical protein